MYEDLINSNIGLVKSIALKFRPSRFDLEDYYQIGFIGLIKSARSFRGGSKFSVFAYKSIFWEISKYHKKQKRKINYTMLQNNNDRIQFFTDEDLELLDDDELKIIDLFLINEYSVKDISQALNKSKATIYRKINSIVKKIKDARS